MYDSLILPIEPYLSSRIELQDYAYLDEHELLEFLTDLLHLVSETQEDAAVRIKRYAQTRAKEYAQVHAVYPSYWSGASEHVYYLLYALGLGLQELLREYGRLTDFRDYTLDAIIDRVYLKLDRKTNVRRPPPKGAL